MVASIRQEEIEAVAELVLDELLADPTLLDGVSPKIALIRHLMGLDSKSGYSYGLVDAKAVGDYMFSHKKVDLVAALELHPDTSAIIRSLGYYP